MGIHKVDSYIEVYKLKSKSKSISAMADRTHAATQYINERILKHICFSVKDRVLDVGCGDGTLLAFNSSSFHSGLGISPTNEEVSRLNLAWSTKLNVKFKVGLATTIPADDSSFDKVICNSVLLLLPSLDELEQAINEIFRVTKPGGAAWLGEILVEDELENARKNYDNSLIKWLLYIKKTKGISAFLKASADLAKCYLSREPFIIQPKNPLVVSSEKFQEICKSSGFKIKSVFDHDELGGDQKVFAVKSRLNFLVERP